MRFPIYQNGQRAEHIINSMMQHARVKEGSLRDTDLNALLDEAVGLAYHSKRVQSFEFTATIEKDYAPDLSRLQCFPSELSRAFINIVDNAFYAIDKNDKQQHLEYIPTLSLKTCSKIIALRSAFKIMVPGFLQNIISRFLNLFSPPSPPIRELA
jgi:nitrogen fixation/metabolism regulation signal transduction histidine kinase